MSLREGAIEAIGRKAFNHEKLDALLDYLEANADEWDEAALTMSASDDITTWPGYFIAALRMSSGVQEGKTE